MRLFDDWPDDMLRGIHHYDEKDYYPLQKPAQNETREGISRAETEAPNGQTHRTLYRKCFTQEIESLG